MRQKQLSESGILIINNVAKRLIEFLDCVILRAVLVLREKGGGVCRKIIRKEEANCEMSVVRNKLCYKVMMLWREDRQRVRQALQECEDN